MVPHAHDHLGLPDLGAAWPHACVPETFAETFAEGFAETFAEAAAETAWGNSLWTCVLQGGVFLLIGALWREGLAGSRLQAPGALNELRTVTLFAQTSGML